MTTTAIIAFLIFAVFLLVGVLASGVLSLIGKKVDLHSSIGIEEAEDMIQEEYGESLLKEKEGRKKSWMERKSLELQQSHSGVSITTYMAIMLGASIVFFVAAYLIFRSPIYGILAALMGYFIPNVFVKAKIEKNIKTFNDNLVKALRRMSSNMRAGGTLKQAIMDVGKSQSMPDAIRVEFINILSDMEYGASPEEAFYSLYERVGSDDVKTLALTVEIQRRTGGNMSEAFDNFARIINKRNLEEADIKATLAQTKSSGMIISIMPFLLTIVLNFMSPTYFDSMFAWGDGVGKMIVFACYIMMGIGVVVISKMSKIKV